MGPLEGPPCDPGMVGSGFSILNLRGVGGNALRLIRDGAGELREVRDRAAGGAGKQVGGRDPMPPYLDLIFHPWRVLSATVMLPPPQQSATSSRPSLPVVNDPSSQAHVNSSAEPSPTDPAELSVQLPLRPPALSRPVLAWS